MMTFRSSAGCFFVLFAVSVGSAAHGQEKIMGAFGLKLGEMLDTKTMSPLDKSNTRYIFKPSTPFRDFKLYEVRVTPRSRRIYTIMATKRVFDAKKAADEMHYVSDVLQKKYGVKPIEIMLDKQAGLGFKLDDRVITVLVVATESTSGLIIMYLDAKGAESAKAENAKLRKTEIDADVKSSGL